MNGAWCWCGRARVRSCLPPAPPADGHHPGQGLGAPQVRGLRAVNLQALSCCVRSYKNFTTPWPRAAQMRGLHAPASPYALWCLQGTCAMAAAARYTISYPISTTSRCSGRPPFFISLRSGASRHQGGPSRRAYRILKLCLCPRPCPHSFLKRAPPLALPTAQVLGRPHFPAALLALLTYLPVLLCSFLCTRHTAGPGPTPPSTAPPPSSCSWRPPHPTRSSSTPDPGSSWRLGPPHDTQRCSITKRCVGGPPHDTCLGMHASWFTRHRFPAPSQHHRQLVIRLQLCLHRSDNTGRLAVAHNTRSYPHPACRRACCADHRPSLAELERAQSQPQGRVRPRRRCSGGHQRGSAAAVRTQAAVHTSHRRDAGRTRWVRA